MPEPMTGEAREDFIERCIPIVLDDGTAQMPDQAIAVCNSMYDGEKGKTVVKRNIERKTFSLKIASIDGRTVEGYAAVFGNVDQGGDVIHQGAFTKTLVERGGKVKFLWQHDMGEPIGKVLEMREDEAGLWFKAAISDTARGRDALALLHDGAIDGMSIGYDAIPGGTAYRKADTGESIRHLREIRLWEISLVTFPMNESAGVTALKTTSGATDLPLANRDRTWDSAAAMARVRRATGSEDAPNERYRQAFFWYDSENADQFGAYKLQFADVVDGELAAIPRAIFAVAAILRGGRGGVDIPENDRAGVERRVNRYYDRMRAEFDDDSIQSPLKAFGDPSEQKTANVADVLEAAIHSSFTSIADDLLGCGVITREERIALSGFIGDSLGLFSRMIDDNLFELRTRPRWQAIDGTQIDWTGQPIIKASKIGRAISAANEQRIMSVIDGIDMALDDLRQLIGTMPGDEMPEDEMPDGEMSDEKANNAPDKAAFDDGAGPQDAPTSETLMEQLLVAEVELNLMEV